VTVCCKGVVHTGVSTRGRVGRHDDALRDTGRLPREGGGNATPGLSLLLLLLAAVWCVPPAAGLLGCCPGVGLGRLEGPGEGVGARLLAGVVKQLLRAALARCAMTAAYCSMSPMLLRDSLRRWARLFHVATWVLKSLISWRSNCVSCSICFWVS
jgi:hypothetical protein